MKISYVSDLHLEFGGNEFVKLPGGDLLLLAGDFTVVAALDHNPKATGCLREFLDEECSKYKQVLAVLGNHEHYQGFYENTLKNLADWIASNGYQNFHIMNDDVFGLESLGAKNWLVFGATMWTDYNNDDTFAKHAAKRGMNDHWLIKRGIDGAETTFDPDDARYFNRESTNALVRALEDFPEDNFIVMTHHTVDMKSGHERFGGKGNLLNYAFHNTQLSKVVNDYPRIKYWVHGHTHDSMDYLMGDCRVLCNPRGYFNPGGIENKDFDPNKQFEVV